MVYKFFDKNAASITTNQQLSDEQDKQITKKIQNGKVYFSFMDDLCCNPADIELISVFC